MTNRMPFGPLAGVVLGLLGAGIALAQTAPTVSNVQAVPRQDHSKLVDIYYDLASEQAPLCSVWVTVSDDGGQSWCVPAQTFWGDVGASIAPGLDKWIIWDAGADIPGKAGTFRVRIYADDGNGQASMVFVPVGTGLWSDVPSFWIDKYEVTNQRYCEFLNAADPDGAHWDSRMEITKAGIVYAVNAGRQNFPIRYVNTGDASAFAAWLSSREGRTYRLPTENEWMKAAGWDPVEQHEYTYGFHADSISCQQCNYANCVGAPTPVGQYGASYYGCYDMSGNVNEWQSTVWYRGGYWASASNRCTIYFRWNPGDGRYEEIGFRLVMPLNGQ